MRTIQASQTCSRACRISRPRAFTASHAAPVRIQQQQQQQRSVQVQLFKFGAAKPAEDTLPAKKRSDYDREDVDDYFSYMGILAVELNYDRMDAMLAAGIEPIDCILIYACEEGDTPKVNEVIRAGANINVKSINGKRPIDVAKKQDIIDLLKQAGAQA